MTAEGDIKSLIREDFESLETYQPIRPLEELAAELNVPIKRLVKLDANENLYGPIPEVVEAMMQANLHIYPDPSQNAFRDALASHFNIPREKILGGCGSDELLDLLLRLVEPAKVLIANPTFGMYSFLSRLLKIPVVSIPLSPPPHFAVDVDGFISAIRSENNQKSGKPQRILVFLASPNNPTGQVVPIKVLETIASERGVVLVVDEAYAEFSNETALSLVNDHPNVIILRTFSKWAALAGLRIGYAIAPSSFIDCLMTIKQPYNISVAASAAVVTLLSSPVYAKAQANVQAIVAERENLFKLLGSFSWLKPVPSQSNFMLAEINKDVFNITSQEIAKELRQRAIFIRIYPTNLRLANFIRLSVGRPQDTLALAAGLKHVERKWLHAKKEISKRGKLTTILFDMDGVLADVSQSYRVAIELTVAAFGVKITPEDISKFKAQGNANNDWVVSHRMLELNGVTVPFDDVKAKFEELYQGTANDETGLWRRERLLLNVNLLETLRQLNLRLGIVTGRPRKDCDRFLEFFNIKQYFDVCVCMEDAPLKPSPEPVLLAYKLLNPEEEIDGKSLPAFLIGDTPDDIRAAVAAGALGIGIEAPSDGGKDLLGNMYTALLDAGASAIIDTLEDVLLFVSQ